MDKDLKNELAEIISQSPISNDLDHAAATLKWLLVMEPEASIPLQIAAFGHDIDRGVTKITEKDRASDVPYHKFKQMHADRSASILVAILEQNNFDKAIIKEVERLAKNHETGGDSDSDLLRDADSIAYFELNIPVYLERNGEEKTKDKISFMYNRASDRAKKIIKKMPLDQKFIEGLI